MRDRIPAIDDRRGFEKRNAQAQRAVRKARHPELREIRKATVAMDMLTKSSEFNGFLEQVQALHDDAAASVESALQRFQTSKATDYATLVAEKLEVHTWLERQRALAEVLALPSKNKANGAAAAAELAEEDEDLA